MAISYVWKHMNFANIRFICFENKKFQTYKNGHFICLQTCEMYQCMIHIFGTKMAVTYDCKPENRPTCDSLVLEMKSCKHMKFYQRISLTREQL